MFDIIYVTWFVQIASLVWGKFWYLYLIVSLIASLVLVLTRLLTLLSQQIPGTQLLSSTKTSCFRTCSAVRARSPRFKASSGVPAVRKAAIPPLLSSRARRSRSVRLSFRLVQQG